ncbi:porin [Burkholderia stabilis]|uniref:Porin n=1 Tax=Burkholderia stabilis TaxID=95485 RepID=A0A4V1PQR7_9BURK|nr:porin [Burkholderia stabilis]RXV65034.1 porin [Burkholderia stabilis]
MKVSGDIKSCGRSTLVGLALVGFGITANAQSSVTLYGVVDAGLLYTTKSLNTATGGNAGHQYSMLDSGSGASRFGIKGSEDLGGGMKAIFTLESGISMAKGGSGNSNGNLFGRQAWVGLTSGFGTVQVGLQYSPFALSLINTDARDASYFGSGAGIYIGNVLTTGLFNPNGVSYTSPVIAGFQASAMLALGGQPGDVQAGRQYSARLKYHYGGLVVDAAMYNGNAGGTAATTPIPSAVAFTGRTIGAIYEFGSWTLKASFANFKVAGAFDTRVYDGGLSYFVTPSVKVDAGVWYVSDGNNTANHTILAATGAQYFLSKRTALYGQVAYVNNHGAMHTGLSINNALHEASGSTTGVNVGIRHSF